MALQVTMGMREGGGDCADDVFGLLFLPFLENTRALHANGKKPYSFGG